MLGRIRRNWPRSQCAWHWDSFAGLAVAGVSVRYPLGGRKSLNSREVSADSGPLEHLVVIVQER